jgi:cytochrome c553
MKTPNVIRGLLLSFVGTQLLGIHLPINATRVAASETFSSESIEFFEKKIRPLLANNCFNCHSANTNSQGGLRLDDRNGQLVGGNSGAALVPGDIEKSLIIQVVEHAEGVSKMPPKKKLSDDQIADLKKWVADGAAWPSAVAPADINSSQEEYQELLESHWAWQPIKAPSIPTVQDSTWANSNVDRFIQKEIESKGLRRALPADRVALIRRVTFDITGLPPSPEEIDSFVLDNSDDAYQNVIDRLLASSAYGERWGRHWLDVARYGESTGSSRNLPTPHAWRFRDYVLNAFATDKPFDLFIKEQIAGDLLPSSSEAEKEALVTATGFLAIGVKDVNQRYKVRFDMDNIDEQIDVVSRGFLGVTASCARCHDHKFDPIPTNDYYALAGIFKSTDICAGLRNKMGGGGLAYYDTDKLIVFGQNEGVEDQELTKKIAEAKAAVEGAQKEFAKLRNDPAGDEKLPNGRPRRQVARQKMNRAQQELLALTDPSASGRVVQGVRESKEIGDTEIRYRGEAEELGPKVPRGFLGLASYPNQPTIDASQSGRLQLAEWIAHNDNPLTSRVVVNRVWKHLFGRGIVATVDNFGVNGDRPTHPELLDYLALQFQKDGWSVKTLIRNLVLTRTYQLGSENIASNSSVDPENLYLWRHLPRRLDAEEIRDATLVAASALDLSPPKASPAKDLPVIEIRNNGKESKILHEFSNASTQRSVYLPLVRGITPQSLEVFDFAEQGTVVGARSVTTVPPQSLYLLNDTFVRNNSLAVAKILLAKSELNDEDRIQQAYKRILNRNATSDEVTGAVQFIEEAQQISELIEDLKKSPSLDTIEKPKSVVMVSPSPAASIDATAGQPAIDSGTADSTTDGNSDGNSDVNVSSAVKDAARVTRKPLGEQESFEVELNFSFKIRSNGLLVDQSEAIVSEPNVPAVDENKAAPTKSVSSENANSTTPVTSPEVAAPRDTVSPSTAAPTTEPTLDATAPIKASGDEKPKLAPVIDPDQILTVEERPEQKVFEPSSPREAAWANFVQALLGSAEFRYLK